MAPDKIPKGKTFVCLGQAGRHALYTNKKTKKLTIILAIILTALISERVIFTTNSVKVEINPEVLRANTSSQLEIHVFPANLVGFRTPFRNVQVRFEIEEGKNLIELFNESTEGTVTVRSKGVEGEAVVGIYSLKSGAQISRVLIKIMPGNLT